MKEATTYINEHQRNAENLAKIAEIKDNVTGLPPVSFREYFNFILFRICSKLQENTLEK